MNWLHQFVGRGGDDGYGLDYLSMFSKAVSSRHVTPRDEVPNNQPRRFAPTAWPESLEQAAGITWNAWPPSRGITGRMAWNTHSIFQKQHDRGDRHFSCPAADTRPAADARCKTAIAQKIAPGSRPEQLVFC